MVIVPVCAVVKAQTLGTEAEDKVFDFITEVMGIDTAKYEITQRAYSASYPSKYGSSVKEELTTLVLNSIDGSEIEANVIFHNGYIYGSTFSLYGPISKDQAFNVSSLEKAKNALSRYQNFTSKLGIYNDEVPSALMMLSSVKELAPLSMTNGNMKMQITCSGPNLETREDYNINIKFFHTNNGVDNTWKCLSVGFECIYGTIRFVFVDRWGLYSTYSTSLPCLSEIDAKAIAWEAAKNYQIKLVTANNSTVLVTPTWPESPTVDSSIIMTLGQLYNGSESLGLSMGSTPRDGLTLYPLWQFLFYCQPIGGMQGIQVGVWGDTKEIAYCGSYGHYGAPDSSPASTPTPSPTEENSQTQDFTLPVTLATVAMVALAVGILVYFKRRKG